MNISLNFTLTMFDQAEIVRRVADCIRHLYADDQLPLDHICINITDAVDVAEWARDNPNSVTILIADDFDDLKVDRVIVTSIEGLAQSLTTGIEELFKA